MAIVSTTIRRLSSAATPSTASITRLQETVDKWPMDASKGHRDVRIYLQQHARNVIADGNATEIDQEAASLEKLISNHHRDRYPLPKGLGGSPPIIAATGLDLNTVSNLLANGGDGTPKKSFWGRVLRFFS